MWVSRHSSGDCSWFCPYCPGLVSQDQESSRHLMTHHSRLSHYRLVDVVQVPCPSRMYQPAINHSNSINDAGNQWWQVQRQYFHCLGLRTQWLGLERYRLGPMTEHTGRHTHCTSVSCKINVCQTMNIDISFSHCSTEVHSNLSFQSIHFWTNWFVSVKNQLFDSFAPFGRAQQSADPAATLHCVLQFNDSCFFITCT